MGPATGVRRRPKMQQHPLAVGQMGMAAFGNVNSTGQVHRNQLIDGATLLLMQRLFAQKTSGVNHKVYAVHVRCGMIQGRLDLIDVANVTTIGPGGQAHFTARFAQNVLNRAANALGAAKNNGFLARARILCSKNQRY